jgi:hypothetical protein
MRSLSDETSVGIFRLSNADEQWHLVYSTTLKRNPIRRRAEHVWLHRPWGLLELEPT